MTKKKQDEDRSEDTPAPPEDFGRGAGGPSTVGDADLSDAPEGAAAPRPPHHGTGTGPHRPAVHVHQAAGKLPRVVDPRDRVAEGSRERLVRFKIRCVSGGAGMPPLYVLARPDDEAAARECYLREVGVDPADRPAAKVTATKLSD